MAAFTVLAGPNNRQDPEIPAEFMVKRFNDWQLEERDGEFITIYAKLLGFSSSERRDHTHELHSPGAKPTRCGACRWQETRIFLVESGIRPRYAVHTLGVSILSGETTFVKISFVGTGFEVVELLTVRQGDRATPYIPSASARALAMAAAQDDDIQHAYVNRAVA